MKKLRYKKLHIKLFHLHKISRKGKLVIAYGWGRSEGQGEQGLTANKHRELLWGDGYSPAVWWWWLHCSTNSLKVMELYTYHRGILWYIHYISATLFFKIQYYVVSRYAYRRAVLILKTIRLHWSLISTRYHWWMVSCYGSRKHGHPRTCCPTELPAMRETVYKTGEIEDLSLNLADICLQLNGHVWLLATLLQSSALQACLSSPQSLKSPRGWPTPS